jgi:hypothetical protein
MYTTGTMAGLQEFSTTEREVRRICKTAGLQLSMVKEDAWGKE